MQTCENFILQYYNLFLSRIKFFTFMFYFENLELIKLQTILVSRKKFLAVRALSASS